ncbi:MAG TPA: hypothetical protein VKJ45_02390 [Blastocatellia bacterium]|nr:hypothetical protein [Blastocatellia bacterium]
MSTSKNIPIGFRVPGGEIGALAPAESVRRTQRADKGPEQSPFEQWVVSKLIARLNREDQDLDRRRFQKGTRNVKYYEGEQNGFFGRYTNQFYTYDSQDSGDPQRTHNSFRYYSDAITTQWVQGRADLKVIPILRDATDDHTEAAVRKANQILDYYETTRLTEDFLQDECKNEQFFGGAFRLTYWDPDIGQTIERPVFGETRLQLGANVYSCRGCGRAVQAEEAKGGRCLDCGGALEVEPGPAIEVVMITGTEEIKAGDLRVEQVPPLEVKFDRAGGKFEKATYVRRRRRLRTEVVSATLPWWQPEGGSGAGDNADDPGLHYQRLAQRSIGNTGQSSNYMTLSSGGSYEDGSRFTVVDQWWFSAVMYSDERLKWSYDIELAGGSVIPAGTPLKEVFPEGLYCLVVNGEILDQRNESFLDHWQYTPFISLPTRADGDGIEDMCEPQRQTNRFKALMEESAAYRSSPPTLYRSEYIKRSKYSNKPREMYPVQGLPLDKSLAELVYQPAGSQLTAEVTEFLQMLDGDMQKYSKGWSTSTGAPDVRAMGAMKTATGASLMSQNASAQRAPELAQRACGDVKWAMQALKLFQRHAVYERYLPFQGRSGDQGGAWFKGADIDAEFEVAAKQRSWLPKSETDRQNRLQMALQVLGIAAKVNPGLASNPAFQEHVAETYDVPLDVFDSSDPDRELAARRIDQMRRAFKKMVRAIEVFEMGPDAAGAALAGVIDPPIHASENHQVANQYYAEWLKSREGIEAGRMMRDAITAVMDEHMKIGSALQQGMQAQALETNAPAIAHQNQQMAMAMAAKKMATGPQTAAPGQAGSAEI